MWKLNLSINVTLELILNPMHFVNFLNFFQVSHAMQNSLSHVAKATAKGRNVIDKDIEGLVISKSADDPFNTEPPQIKDLKSLSQHPLSKAEVGASIALQWELFL